MERTIRTPEQQKMALMAPFFPLDFLVDPERRAKKPNGMESFSQSACFHRLMTCSGHWMSRR